MKKLIIVTALAFLFYPVSALAETAESKSSPSTIQKIAPNSYYYNYNIEEIQKDPDGDGPMEAETFYQYNYVEVQGKPTKAKVVAAIKAAWDTTEADINTAPDLLTAEADMKTSILANKTDAQIATYITNNVTDLASSKLFLYKLTKEVRDIIKRNGWE